MAVLFFLISLLASIVGAICGIGGGIIIKPALDAFHFLSVPAVSFLSGCTVLSMTCYSVARAFVSKDNAIELRIGTKLAVGAVAGGYFGKQLFTAVGSMYENINTVGAIQAVCLFALTLGTLVYTINQQKIKTHKVSGTAACLAVGLILGLISSFLGIGGGPVNIVFLSFFFSMDIKTASKNSLYIIFFSQLANLLATLAAGSVPSFPPLYLVFMCVGGICGGAAGRALGGRIDERVTSRLFIGLMCVIMLVCIYNAWQYTF